MQLHPNDQSFDVATIKRIIEDKKVIGLGQWDKGQITISQFKDEMKIGDIVAIKQGAILISLVKVISHAYFKDDVDENFDWFQNRRDIELIEFNDDNLNYNIQQPRGTLSRCKDLNTPTSQTIINWYREATNRNIIKNMKLSEERVKQINKLWDEFKEDAKDKYKEDENKLNDVLSQWEKYREKIVDGGLTLDDYTNRVGSDSAEMPGGYLCNFLERTSRDVLGSSRPGSANQFGVKLNSDNKTYYIAKPENKKASKEDADKYFNENIKGLIENIVKSTDPLDKISLIEESSYSAKQVLMKLAVLDNLTDFIYMYSAQAIDELYNEFIGDVEVRLFAKNHQVCSIAKEILKVDGQDGADFALMSRFLWEYANSKSIADKNNPNVIYYGAPGTGKTYSVSQHINFTCKGDTSKYNSLQFHPSFTYEDFIEGIKPKGVTENGNIRFEIVNGVFKDFCIKAKNDPTSDYYFIVDEINRANLSNVFGETLSLLEKDYRDTPNGGKRYLIQTQYSSLIENLIKEDRDNKYKHLAYDINDEGKVMFGVPHNVFFIGMMNDVDKSIDTFDLALRRRFKWIRMECDYEVVESNLPVNVANCSSYIEGCQALNKYISEDLGLGKSYEFGHSFFMKMNHIVNNRKAISKRDASTLFDLYLRPTLREYLRSIFPEKELDIQLDKALGIFNKDLA